MNWPHKAIQEKALRYIKKASMTSNTWAHTAIGNLQGPINSVFMPKNEELPLVACYFSDASWYAFTTLRIVGNYYGHRVDEFAYELEESNFGNFKGLGQKPTEIMTLRFHEGRKKRLEYETGKPSAAPIYATRYWDIKFPFLSQRCNLSILKEKK